MQKTHKYKFHLNEKFRRGIFVSRYFGVQFVWASQMALVVKNLPANAGDARDLGSVPGLSERSPGEGNGNPLHYACLGNPMDRGARMTTVHGVPELHTTEHTSLIAFAFDVISKTSLYLFIFEEMSIQVLCPFLNWIICLPIFKLYFLYLG